MQYGKILGVPERVLVKAPSDGLGTETDEEKLGVTYKQISEMIETGETEENAKNIIIEKFKASSHKRKNIPKYTFERKNYLLEMEE